MSTLLQMSEPKQSGDAGVGVVCPYCGHAQAAVGPGQARCGACKGLFDPLSRQATQNAMGPWWVLNPTRPTAPGISYEKLCDLVRRGKVSKASIVRGPTTRQFWALARDTAGVAVLLGECHNCHREVMPDEFICRHCSTVLAPRSDRQHLGLAPVQLLPGEASPEEIAASTRASLTNPGTPAPARQPAMPSRTPSVQTTPAPAGEAAGASSTRRMRQQMARQRLYLVILLIFVGVLVAAVAILILDPFAGVTIGGPKRQTDAASPGESSPFPPPPGDAASPGGQEPAGDTPSDTTQAPPEVDLPEMPPPIPDDAVPLDAALEPWRERFDEAMALERLDSIESVTRAIAMIESILAEARDTGAGSGDYPLAEDRLEALRDRLEALELREQFGDDGV